MKYFFLSLALSLASCDAGKSKSNKVSTTEIDKKNTSPSQSLPSISQELMDKMYAEVDYIDYIWHDLPISLSIDKKEEAYTNVGLISQSPVGVIPANCKPRARKFFNIKGNTIMEADVYIDQSCQFYVFIEKGKPVAANYMTQQAVEFYNGVFAQVKQ